MLHDRRKRKNWAAGNIKRNVLMDMSIIFNNMVNAII